MSWYRKNPVFAGALAFCALLVAGELWCIYERFSASRANAAKLDLKRTELASMAELTPPPTRGVAAAIETDLARARRALAAMEGELKGRGPAAERMHTARVPVARTDAYFDLASFVERTRELAKKSGVEVRPEASRFGFAAYANEAPEVERIEAVFHQCQIAQYLIEALFEAHPRTLLSVRREYPLTKKEREEHDAAVASATNGGPPVEAPSLSGGEGTDFFVIDPRVSVRAPGFLDSTAFRLTFVGQTASLRAFLNRLAAFELPVLVREVEVETANAEEVTASVTTSDETASTSPTDAAPASVVLTAEDPPPPKIAPKKPSAKASATAPIVSKPFSKFTVIVEYVDFAPPPAPAENATAPGAPTA